MQEHNQELYTIFYPCTKDTWHVESNHILQPPKYRVINVNTFNYIDIKFMKNRSDRHYSKYLTESRVLGGMTGLRSLISTLYA